MGQTHSLGGIMSRQVAEYVQSTQREPGATRRHEVVAQRVDRNAVVEEYAHLIKKVAYKLIARLPANVELDDLMSAGVIGLIDAAEKYDPEKSRNFRGYAEIRIRGAMLDELRALDWVPRSVRQRCAAIDSVSGELTRRLGRRPSDIEIAEEMDISVPDFRELAERARPVTVVSYEDVGSHDGEERRDCVADPNAVDPEDVSEQCSGRRRMMRAIQRLPPRKRVVLTLYYYEDLNLREIGSILGVTESRISQIHSAAVGQLREILDEMPPD